MTADEHAVRRTPNLFAAGSDSAARWRSSPHRVRTVLVGLLAVVVIIVTLALALGGKTSTTARKAANVSNPALPKQSSGLAPGHGNALAGVPARTEPAPVPSGISNSTAGSAGSNANAPLYASEQRAVGSGVTASGSTVQSGSTPARVVDNNTGSSPDESATKIVKTGTIELTVPKGQVGRTIAKLSELATNEGGYVSSSQTDSGTDPTGQITLRIPVGKFGAAVASAGTLGKVVNETTHAQDVTGKYVDLKAREHALEQTRATYLTILSHASSIGATLAVQDRIDGVQQQIEELHGQIKVLGNQSSYSTLTADVSQQGAVNALVRHHHPRKGLAKAWHTSWSRFSRGIDAIVGAIGPLVLALLLLGLLTLVIWLGVRATQRANRGEGAHTPTG